MHGHDIWTARCRNLGCRMIEEGLPACAVAIISGRFFTRESPQQTFEKATVTGHIRIEG